MPKDKEQSWPNRSRPAHLPVVEVFNRSNIVYVTVCTHNRNRILATPQMHDLIVKAWQLAEAWVVGRYVVMPDHVHFFCAPVGLEYPPPKKWVEYWKSLVARAVKGRGPLGGTASTPSVGAGGTAPSITSAGIGAGGTAPSSELWQRDFWDTQLRNGESYTAKWSYVRNNPVRAELVKNADAWPYQGELVVLRW